MDSHLDPGVEQPEPDEPASLELGDAGVTEPFGSCSEATFVSSGNAVAVVRADAVAVAGAGPNDDDTDFGPLRKLAFKAPAVPKKVGAAKGIEVLDCVTAVEGAAEITPGLARSPLTRRVARIEIV